MEIPLHLGKVCLLPRDALDCCEPEAQLIKSPFFPPSSLFPSRLAMQSCWSRHSAAPKVIAPASTGIWDARTPLEEAELEGDAQLAVLCCAAVTALVCQWDRSLSGYRNNPLKMTVLVRSVITRAVRLCPWKVVCLRLQVCFSFSLSSTMTESR